MSELFNTSITKTWHRKTIIQKALIVAATAHSNQVRKYTGEPYLRHLENVGYLVNSVTDIQSVIAAAILHDILEDTHVKYEFLVDIMLGRKIANLVREVTDISTLKDGNRAARKKLDREHLAAASPDAKTIKLADLIDNTLSIVKHDKGFAKVYLKEKELLLPLLKEGHPLLYKTACQLLEEGKAELNI